MRLCRGYANAAKKNYRTISLGQCLSHAIYSAILLPACVCCLSGRRWLFQRAAPRLCLPLSLSAQRDDAAAGSKTYASQTPIAADYEPLDLRTPSQPPGIAYHYCYWPTTTRRRMPSRLASPHQTRPHHTRAIRQLLEGSSRKAQAKAGSRWWGGMREERVQHDEEKPLLSSQSLLRQRLPLHGSANAA